MIYKLISGYVKDLFSDSNRNPYNTPGGSMTSSVIKSLNSNLNLFVSLSLSFYQDLRDQVESSGPDQWVNSNITRFNVLDPIGLLRSPNSEQTPDSKGSFSPSAIIEERRESKIRVRIQDLILSKDNRRSLEIAILRVQRFSSSAATLPNSAISQDKAPLTRSAVREWKDCEECLHFLADCGTYSLW